MDSEEEGVPLARGGGRRAACGAWLRRRLPALRWARGYGRGAALADLVAGVTLGLTLVPQSIAYAALAELPVQHGLYSAFLGTMLYAAVGSVKEVSIGPTSLMALLTLQLCRGLPVDFVVLLTFLAGCAVLLMGVLRLGFLVEFISPAVTSGFTSATALLVAVAQLKGLLGLSFTAESLAENVSLLASHVPHTRAPDCALSAACCVVLLALRKLKDLPLSPKRRRLRRALWLLSISRNALVVCGAAALAYCVHRPAGPLFKLSGRVEAGVPRLRLPPFSTTLGNRTVGFAEMVATLGPGAAVLPFVMVLANIAIAKAFTVGGRVDATQEMVALGLCNVAGALAGAMPTCGAFTRSAVGHASGVRTPAAALYSGLITLLALNFLTQYFYYIPKACLSSVLVCAVIFMVDVRGVARWWRAGGAARAQAGVALGTLALGAACGVQLAVPLGAAAALALALRSLLRSPPPPDAIKVRGGLAVRVRAPRVLLYVNAERLEARALRAARAAPAAPAAPLLLDCGALAHVDYPATEVLERLIEKLKAMERQVVLYRASAALEPQLRAVRGLDARPLRARTAQAALDAAAAPHEPREPHAPIAAPLLAEPAAPDHDPV